MPKIKKSPSINNQLAVTALVLLVGLAIGNLYASSNNQALRNYARTSAQMMQTAGQTDINAGQMMGQAGQMMQQRGKRWGDTEMVRLGDQLVNQSSMMGTSGKGMMDQGSGMMGMMGGW